MSLTTSLMSPATTFSRRVLGIDPGLARLGWAVLNGGSGQTELIGCGCLETAAALSTPQRLQKLHRRLNQIVYEYRPDRLAVEKLFFTKNVTTGMTVGQARGIVLLVAAEHDLPVVELTPTAVKASVTGDGRADKRQMQRMIQILLRLKRLPRYDDTADAIAIALCAVNRKVVH